MEKCYFDLVNSFAFSHSISFSFSVNDWSYIKGLIQGSQYSIFSLGSTNESIKKICLRGKLGRKHLLSNPWIIKVDPVEQPHK